MEVEESGVIASDGQFYRYGHNSTRTKLFDADGTSITKSCHVCQDQHVYFKCLQKALCAHSFCRKCTEKYHPDLSFEEIMKCCPTCRGICSCRKCLRKMNNPKIVIEQTVQENKENAETILKCCGQSISQILKLYDEQAQILDTTLEKIKVYHYPGFAFTCDRCSTAIADFHFGCASCTEEDEGGKEVCVSCVAECRTFRDQQVLKQLLTCKSCGCSLIPKRLISNSKLGTLRRIVEEYGLSQDHPILPVFGPSKETVVCNMEVEEAEGRVRVQLGVEVEMEDQEKSPEVIERLEDELKSTEGIDWRDSGHGIFIRVVDYLKCKTEDLYKILELSIWKGEPFIINNVRGVMDWRPETMIRAFVEKDGYIKERRSCTDEDEVSDPSEVCVIQCKKNWRTRHWKQSRFFKEYSRNDSDSMYKIKDWPPDESFAEKLPRHNQDFIEMLPCPLYTNPISGVLNQTRALPESCCRPDIGPKTYIATGRDQERGDGTDSVTKLHLDMSDAVNIVLHSHKKPQEDSKGAAVWYVIGRRDVDRVKTYLNDINVFCEKSTYLKAEQREELAQQGVQIWTFFQDDNEAVYVPSGCPHQVRNTRACLKVAVDFFPPQSTAVVMSLTEELRRFGIGLQDEEDTDAVDTLQGHGTILYAGHEAYKVLRGNKKKFEVLYEEPEPPRKAKKRKLK